MIAEFTSFHLFIENTGHKCREDDAVFLQYFCIWDIPSKYMLLSSAAEVVEDFSQMMAPVCLVQ